MKRTIIIRDPDAPTGVATPIAKSHGSTIPGGLPAVGSAKAGSHTLRAILTIGCALIADGMQWLVPFLWPVWDGAMVLALLLLWGWRWEILIVVVPELIPGLALAPTWTIFAGYLVLSHRRQAK